MATFTDSPVWVNKVKAHFYTLDRNNDGICDENDLLQSAKFMAEDEKVEPEVEQEYYQTLKRFLGYGVVAVNPKGVTANEYIEGMKQLVNLPDAKERARKSAEMFFPLMDSNKDGVISFDELFAYVRRVYKMKEDMIELIYKSSDLNNDGVIDLDEFCTMFERYYLTDEQFEKD